MEHSKNSLVRVGKKTEKKGKGVGQEWEFREILYVSENVIYQHVCALQQLTLKCVKSWLFASNSVSLFEGFTALKHE